MIDLGLDFGGTGVRAAYAAPGAAARLRIAEGAAVPLLCEPAAGRLPVAFPSLKSRLGTPGGDHVVEPVVAVLDRMRRDVVAESGEELGRVVLSVPASYPGAQRAALLAAARKAGLGEPELITDSLAAVIGHADRDGSGTYLVVGMGYSGFELGLVRSARGRVRALGYETSERLGGGVIDSVVIGACVDTLRRHGIDLVAGWGEASWRQMRADTEQAKVELLFGEDPTVPIGRYEIQFGAPQREELLRQIAVRLLDRADSLFEQSRLTREDLNTVLLVGGGTRPSGLRAMLAGLGPTLVTAAPELLALGALRHAGQLGGRAVVTEDQVAISQDERPAAVPSLTATLITPPGMPAVAEDPLNRARQLIEQHRPAEAVRELKKLIEDAQSLLDSLPTSDPLNADPLNADRLNADPLNADRLRAAADRLIAKGAFAEAVSRSHQAAQVDPTSTAVFDAMIDVHCTAAMAASTTDQFADAKRWLMCALQHDPSSDKVRATLAERTYRHADKLSKQGRSKQAKEAVDSALAVAPDHAEAKALRDRLMNVR